MENKKMNRQQIKKDQFPKYIQGSGAFETYQAWELALHLASSQEGEVEIKPNWSPKIKIYLASAGIGFPSPWCAAFVTWCLICSGVDKKCLPSRPASTASWYKWARITGRATPIPKRGDLFVWVSSKGLGHIGFVREVIYNSSGDLLAVKTIEGNTNKAGHREGVKVAYRERSLSSLKKNYRFTFISLRDL